MRYESVSKQWSMVDTSKCETDPGCRAASGQLTSKNLAQCRRVIGGCLRRLDGIARVCFQLLSHICICLSAKSSSQLLLAASRNLQSFTTTISVDDFSPPSWSSTDGPWLAVREKTKRPVGYIVNILTFFDHFREENQLTNSDVRLPWS